MVKFSNIILPPFVPKRKIMFFATIGSLIIGIYFISIFSSIIRRPIEENFNNTPNSPAYLPGCQPSNKFVFLKTYRCGTTNLMALLIKYAEKNKLIRQIVKPNMIRNGPFNRTYVADSSINGDYIFGNIIWNRDEVMALLGPSIVSFTILRDPYILFESYFSYVNLGKEFGIDMKGFIQLLRQSDPMNWNNSSVLSSQQIERALYDYGSAVNLGMPIASLQDDQAIDNHIAKIEKEMNLVMITERMEESLILFRYVMCWKPEDIVVFDHSVRMSSSVTTLGDDDKKELKKWLKADEKVYNHFYKIFEEKVAKYPGDMKREIRQRIDAREELRADCLMNHEKNPACHGFNSLVADTRDNLV